MLLVYVAEAEASLPWRVRTDLLQREDELVKRPPLRQARPVHGHVVEQRQHGDLVRRHPVLDAKHIGVDHPVGHHRVEIETFVDARHGGGPAEFKLTTVLAAS